MITSIKEFIIITWFIHSSIYPFACPSIHLFIHLPVHPFIYLSICLSIHSSIYPFVCPSIHLSIHLSVPSSIYLSICLSLHPSIYYLSVHASIFTYTFLVLPQSHFAHKTVLYPEVTTNHYYILYIYYSILTYKPFIANKTASTSRSCEIPSAKTLLFSCVSSNITSNSSIVDAQTFISSSC